MIKRVIRHIPPLLLCCDVVVLLRTVSKESPAAAAADSAGTFEPTIPTKRLYRSRRRRRTSNSSSINKYDTEETKREIDSKMLCAASRFWNGNCQAAAGQGVDGNEVIYKSINIYLHFTDKLCTCGYKAGEWGCSPTLTTRNNRIKCWHSGSVPS